MQRLKRILILSCTLTLIGLLCVVWINHHVKTAGNGLIRRSITEVPPEDTSRVAIVFGARVWDDGAPSAVLYDRVVTAVELYRAGRVRKILMSGDNPTRQYDEPTAMKNTAVGLGVPENDIVLDFAGRRTYDTCFRAKDIFDIRSAIIVTQEYHQPRALYLCNGLGVDSIGVTSDRRTYRGLRYWAFREFFSVASAWLEMKFISFEPIRGEKEPIFRQGIN
jgi:SanA protein